MRRLIVSLLIAVTAATLLFLLIRNNENPRPNTDTGHAPAPNTTPPTQPTPPKQLEPVAPPVPFAEIPKGTRPVPGAVPDDRFTRLDDGRSISNEGYAAARALHQPDTTVEDDLDQIEAVIALYTWAFQELPEGGENYEMMTALTGDNPHQMIFFPPDHGSFDSEGNLLDRWGTPYFFHKISDQELDVVSAGPDRRLWTVDDVGLGRTEDYSGEYNTAASN
ncbi:MAG: hypothetical protein AAF591_18425 [Verrucomicrobiota bacterium]